MTVFSQSILTAAVLAGAIVASSCNKNAEPPPAAQPAQPAHDPGHATSPPPAATPVPAQPQPPSSQAKPLPQPPATSKPPRGYTGPLPPLPRATFPPPRPAQVVEAVYEFAARHPEVLRHVPCFCGCESHGHVGNDDCFVASRAADGRPTWDTHGYG